MIGGSRIPMVVFVGGTIVQPAVPKPTPQIQAPAAWTGPNAQPLAPLRANNGALAAPDDAVVDPLPPKLPKGL